MRFSRTPFFAVVVSLCLFATAGATAATRQQEREDVERMASSTLERLYEVQPSARSAVESAVGYAVFRATGAKIFLAGGGMGSGLAVDNGNEEKVYMKMAEIQAGLGFGIKKFRLVWVFEDRVDFDGLINSGWELSAQSSAAAKVGEQGQAFAGAVSIKPGVWLYQMTDEGLALELTAKGTKYYRDSGLN